nr:MAG TPA: Helix-turn-helix XRE-family like protein [Caudoviricetes sp.]
MAQFNIILKLLRSEKKMTQQDLADALHISKSSINGTV